jgi:predicted ATPase
MGKSMNLKINNIGLIKEANINLDGLTVIAGENDTGKSTVGKSLYLIFTFLSDLAKIKKVLSEQKNKELISNEANRSSRLSRLLFDNQLIDGAQLNLNDKYIFGIKNNQITHENFEINFNKNDLVMPIFVETPLVWNFNKFFNQMANIESQAGIFGDELSIDYPFLLKDLHFKLSVGIDRDGFSIEEDIQYVINGMFKKDDNGNFYFERENQKISLLNTATGIKYFGILQVLSQNNYLNKNTFLVLDEPEVHLHPKWQLKMAQMIAKLVQNGVKILVNSHSPYMIEALQRFSQKYNIQEKANFYLAQDGIIENKNKLQEIYEKLSEPYDDFEQMDIDVLNGK